MYIILLDCSGSMYGVAENYIRKIIPSVLENLDYANKTVQLVTFNDTANFYEYGIDGIECYHPTQILSTIKLVEEDLEAQVQEVEKDSEIEGQMSIEELTQE